MQILNHDEQWTLLTSGQAHLTQEGKRPQLDRFRSEQRQTVCLRWQAKEVTQEWYAVIRVYVELLEGCTHLYSYCFCVVCLGDTAALAEELAEGHIGHGASIGLAMAFHIYHPVRLYALPKLIEEPRLAHTGLSHNADDLSLPFLNLIQYRM
jgi:hypothetical protein